MKNFNLPILFIALAFVTLFSSCDNDKDEVAVSKEDLLTGKRWKTTAFTIDPALFGFTDLYAQFEDCDKDDYMEFKKGGQLIKDEGSTRCDSNDPQTILGTWVFNGDQDKITVSDPDLGTYSVEIIELTSTTLRVQYSIRDEESGVNYTFKSTLVKM